MKRAFVIAILAHVVVLAILGSIKIVAQLPKITASFQGTVLPPAKEEQPDPFAAYREFEYRGPTTGGGGGTEAKGPGGIPSAAQAENRASEARVGEVIRVDAAGAFPAFSVAASAAPTGVAGPGGGGFNQRMGPMRTQALQKFKGSADTERAVMAALRWLKNNQQEDGSWKCSRPSFGSDRAGTALGVLAFLGHGETPDSDEFGPCVNKGLQYLVRCVGADGVVSDRNMYSQGIVTLALSEAYGLTQSPAVREPLERAVNAIVKIQKVKKRDPKDIGGWRYSSTSEDADTSVSGWMVLALKSAKLADIAVPEESFEMASTYLWQMYDGVGFGYLSPGRGAGTTAIGVLCQQFMGQRDDKRIKSALDYLKEVKADWEKSEGDYVLYGWYYETQAMFHAGGAYWDSWNRQIRETMVKSQASDGHWSPPPKSKQEVKDLRSTPVYSTALGCLILEVYYRYLPIYQEMGINP